MRARSQDDVRIRKLENDLYLARALIIELTGPRASEILMAPSDLRSAGDVHRWFRGAVERILEIAETITIDEGLCQSLRAVCPLCGESANDFYRPGPGYKFPVGLRRHLLGAHNSYQCPVVQEALAHALAQIESDKRPGI
jgi:hypothetical protein